MWTHSWPLCASTSCVLRPGVAMAWNSRNKRPGLAFAACSPPKMDCPVSTHWFWRPDFHWKRTSTVCDCMCTCVWCAAFSCAFSIQDHAGYDELYPVISCHVSDACRNPNSLCSSVKHPNCLAFARQTLQMIIDAKAWSGHQRFLPTLPRLSEERLQRNRFLTYLKSDIWCRQVVQLNQHHVL